MERSIHIPQIIPKAEIEAVKGLVPPHDEELENYILASIMTSKEAFLEVIDLLQPSTFYKPVNQQIFLCIIEIYKEGLHPDLLLVYNQSLKLAYKDISLIHLSKLSNAQMMYYGSPEHELKARILAELAIRRELIQQSNEILKNAYKMEFDVFDIVANNEQRINETVEYYTKSQLQSMEQLSTQVVKELEKPSPHTNGVTGVPTGIMEIDKITSGWQKSDMIIIAARPGMGKTAFIISMARNVAVTFKRPIAIFSLEMSAVQLTYRFIANQCEVNSETMRRRTVSEAEMLRIHQRVNPLITAPIFIDDSAGLSLLDFKTKLKRLIKQQKVEIAVIDYLQLMNTGGYGGGNREQEISAISRGIKELAKELNIPIIALSQLSRSVESRADKRPMLSDLRESGAIEQDADIVSFLYRPEYYGLIKDEEGRDIIGEAEFIIAKHRNGSMGTAKMKFIGQYTKFDNLNPIEYSQPLTPNQDFDKFDEVPF